MGGNHRRGKHLENEVFGAAGDPREGQRLLKLIQQPQDLA